MVYICSYSWLLALVSRDLSQTLKIITVVKSEQIHKMKIISLKMTKIAWIQSHHLQ